MKILDSLIMNYAFLFCFALQSFSNRRRAMNYAFTRERQTGLEPATLGLGSQCSTN